jgi:hypothetical protein
VDNIFKEENIIEVWEKPATADFAKKVRRMRLQPPLPSTVRLGGRSR